MKRTLLGAAFAAALAFNPARPALAQVPTGSAGSPNASVVTVQGISGGTGVPVRSVANMTPTDCSGSIATGGTAQNAFTAQTTLHGFIIKNTDASAGGGEPVWISFTRTAVANTAGSYPLGPPVTTLFAGGESFSAPPGFGTNHAVSVIAATTGHKFSCTWW